MSDTDGGAGGSDGVQKGKNTPEQKAAQKRLQQFQAQVDEVIGIMRTNVDNKLSALDKPDASKSSTSNFDGETEHETWCERNWKTITILMLIAIILIIIICDYYSSQWLVLSECSEGILGFRWCFNESSITSTTTPTPSIVQLISPAAVAFAKTLTITEAPVPPTESLLTTLLASVSPTIAAVSAVYTLPSSTPTPAQVVASFEAEAEVVTSVEEAEAVTSVEEAVTSVEEAVTSVEEAEVVTSVEEAEVVTSVEEVEVVTSVEEAEVVTSVEEAEVVTSVEEKATFPPEEEAITIQPVTSVGVIEEITPMPTPPPIAETTPTIVTENLITPSNHLKMLRRQHDVLDPAVQVEPVLNSDGKQIFSLHEVPLYKIVEEEDTGS